MYEREHERKERQYKHANIVKHAVDVDPSNESRSRHTRTLACSYAHKNGCAQVEKSQQCEVYYLKSDFGDDVELDQSK